MELYEHEAGAQARADRLNQRLNNQAGLRTGAVVIGYRPYQFKRGRNKGKWTLERLEATGLSGKAT